MRQIVGLGIGLVAFTHGVAGEGTLVFSGFTGFAPARLMAVTNVTQNTIIYAAEKEPHGDDPGKGGVWSAVTAVGGTLTLNSDTSTHADDDILRCIYDDAEVQAPAPQRGGNLWPIDLDACALASGNSGTTDYGPGPHPGTRSTRFVLAGDNEGANTGALTLTGRTDGALFGLAVEIKGSGTLELRIRAVGVASGVTETVGTLAITADSTWRRYILRGYVAQFDCSTIQAEIRATGAGATVEAFGPDLRQLDPGADFPEYQPPAGVAQIIVAKPRTVSLAGYGDSLWAGSAGGSCRPEVQRLLLGAPVYNGGVGGQTSTQVKDRMIADAAKLYRSYGVVLIWAGQNNASAYDTVMDDIAAMVATIPHGRFLIISTALNGIAADHTTGNYTHSQTLWKRMKRRYGNRFVDVLSVLRAGLDYIPSTYLYDSVHPNLVGHGIVAQEIYKAIVRNGWMPGVTAAFEDLPDSGQTHQAVFTTNVAAVVATDNTLLEQGPRRSFRITNDTATGILYVAFGWYASTASYVAKLVPGAVFEFSGYHGQVTGYWTVADGNARVTEII